MKQETTKADTQCSILEWPYASQRTKFRSDTLDVVDDRRTKIAWYVGQRLKAARQDAGWSTRDVAVKLSVFCEDIEDFESGRVPLPVDLLPEICRLFERPLSFWFDGALPR